MSAHPPLRVRDVRVCPVVVPLTRLGRDTLADDLVAVRAARRSIPEDVMLVADFNQRLTVAEAIRRGQALDDEGLYWIEEPVRRRLPGLCTGGAAVRTPVQIGENFSSAFEMHTALRSDASDFVMIDAQQIGGVTGWMAAAALAQVYGAEMSSHLFQEVSAHLLALNPTCGWLEYMNVDDPILAEPLRPVGGMITPSARPGIGLVWGDTAVARYRVA